MNIILFDTFLLFVWYVWIIVQAVLAKANDNYMHGNIFSEMLKIQGAKVRWSGRDLTDRQMQGCIYVFCV